MRITGRKDLAAARAAALVAVDETAEAVRGLILRDGASPANPLPALPGQMAVYLAKEAQARACLADAAPSATAYPHCATEAERIAPGGSTTVAGLHDGADVIVAQADAWHLAADAIEQIRLVAKDDIRAAASPATIDARVAAAAAALSALV